MRLVLHSNSFYIFGAITLIGIALILLISAIEGKQKTLVTAIVDRGDVIEVVSVSGVVEADQTAKLAFPVSGVVTEVFVDEGVTVEAGEVLATLASSRLVAERLDAVAALRSAEAQRDQLIAGPRDESRAVTAQTVRSAEQNLLKVTNEFNERVKNAKRTKLSADLIARSIDADETADAPVVSGTYTCDTEGSYKIKTYNASIPRDFSYRLSGLESGNSDAFFQSPGPLGTCGLFIQFNPTSVYDDSEWTIDIPNQQSSSYQGNVNTYELALIERTEAILAAENSLKLAREEASLSNADPRSEDVTQKNAAVTQARARIQSLDAQIADRSIVAPFSGVITDVTILPGETATAEPVITLLASDTFELTARIPEIDITKVLEGQSVDVLFDAANDTLLTGTVSFISPLATEIDGVAYFEATITLDETPLWIRSGLNADIDVIIKKSSDVVRVPKRFIVQSENESTVTILTSEMQTQKLIEILFTGNDGFAEVTGVSEGDTIVAP